MKYASYSSNFSGSKANLVEIGANGTRIFLPMLPLVGIQIAGIHFYRASGNALCPMKRFIVTEF